VFQSHSSPIAEATVIWTPSGLTSVTAGLSHHIEDANEQSHTGYNYTQAHIVVDHEYLRNVLLSGQVWIANANYLSSNDQQTLYGVDAGATYLLNRSLRLSFSYDYSVSRSSGSSNINYDRNLMLVRLKVAM
jgi:hypothetical protein